MAVEFNVFDDNWRSMTASQRYEYTLSYWAYLTFGNGAPIVSRSSDGQSITYALAEVNKLLEELKSQMSSEGFLGAVQIQPGYFF